MCAADSIDTAFLLPSMFHAVRHAAGINVLSLDYRNTMRSELEAYELFRPDVVVDDCSVTSVYATTVQNVPRLAIVRTGTFQGYEPRNPRHHLSLRIESEPHDLIFAREMNLQLEKGSDFFRGTQYLIPGIRTIEQLPEVTRASTDYRYTGPLLLDDDCIELIVNTINPRAMARVAVERFCDGQRDRPLAFFTFGNFLVPTPEIRECIRRLLRQGIAVISTISIDSTTAAERLLYHHAPYLPMHYLSRRANLIVHQCGSATYQYAIEHETPTITIGSGCFDRDDVAVRLEQLGISRHLVNPAEEPHFVERFMELAELGLADTDRTTRLERVRELKDEIERTRSAFRIGEALTGVLERARERR
jgi:hypothetical protein